MFYVACQRKRQDAEDQDRIAAEAWKKMKKQDGDLDYLVARRGDHLMLQFECYLCVFRKVAKREPVSGKPSDELLLKCIRRVLLDSFWSRASDTVVSMPARLPV